MTKTKIAASILAAALSVFAIGAAAQRGQQTPGETNPSTPSQTWYAGCGPGMTGYGMRGPGMMGYGGYGGYGMMGSGMMGSGPGMMGYGGYGMMGPGMMGNGTTGPGTMRGGAGNPQQGNLNLSTSDVKGYLQRWITMMGNSHIQAGPVTEKDADTITADVVTVDKGGLVQRFSVNRHTGVWQPVQ